MTSCIAVFDIGKTNKKFILFNKELQIVYEEQANFEEVKDDEGENCEDLRAITNWMLATWEKVKLNMNFNVVALNFATYGASLVHLDANNRPVTPLYNYLKNTPSALEESFFKSYGPKEEYHLHTASPVPSMLKSGMQFYWLYHAHPSTFQKIKKSFHFPQFCSFLFTGNFVSEYTSIGCHTGMWDMRTNTYHKFMTDLGFDTLLPPITTRYVAGSTEFRGRQIPVGTGLHDSSSALIPYLHKVKTPFVLLSTGTWCIALNPFSKKMLTKHDLENDCLNYMTFQGNRVKASRLFLGNFHEIFTKRLSGHFFKDKDYFKKMKLDTEYLAKARTKPRLLKDKFAPDAHFTHTDLDVFDSYEEAYHRLLQDMADYQVDALKLASEDFDAISKVYVDGGFSKNELFMKLIQEQLPQIQIEACEISQGTSLGAAMVIKESVVVW